MENQEPDPFVGESIEDQKASRVSFTMTCGYCGRKYGIESDSVAYPVALHCPCGAFIRNEWS